MVVLCPWAEERLHFPIDKIRNRNLIQIETRLTYSNHNRKIKDQWELLSRWNHKIREWLDMYFSWKNFGIWVRSLQFIIFTVL
jgi:hypothetical protein